MGEETQSFTQARVRLEEIVTQVRKKDTSLEQSLDLLEEGVRLANACTELIDHTEWRAAVAEQEAEQAGSMDGDEVVAVTEVVEVLETAEGEVVAVVEVLEEADGTVMEVVEVAEVVETEDGPVVVAATETVEVLEGREFTEADDAWADDDQEPRPDNPDEE